MYIYIYIYIFDAGEAGWATARFHFVLGHDTANCIMTQACKGVQQGATIRPVALRHSQQGHDTADLHMSERQRARERPGHEESRDTNFDRGKGAALVS